MQARLEHKQTMDKRLQEKINGMPEFMKVYYYSLHNKTHMTKKTYLNNVLRFLEYISDNHAESMTEESLNEIKSSDVAAYMQDIEYYSKKGKDNEQKATTKNAIYCSLSNFFTCMEREEIISKNPFHAGKIERAKPKENDIIFLNPDEVKAVKAAIITGVGSATAVARQRAYMNRDLCLFAIPVICGLRVTALSEINLEDLDFANKRIHVTEKGNITKYVYITDEVANSIKAWIIDRNKLMEGREATDALFISNERKRMNVSSIERVIMKYCSAAVPEKHITPHKLRSTFATNAYQTTKDVLLVATLMGHKSPDVTRRYAKVFDENKVDAINKTADLYK